MAAGKTKKPYCAPDEFVYDGVTYAYGFPAETLDKIKTFEFLDTDIIVNTYPKCGTTWMQAILDRVIYKNDQKEVNSASLDYRIPFIEINIPGKISGLELVESKPQPRLIKSHLQAYFFKEAIEKKKTKFIIVMRNPKDALVSYYNFYCALVLFGNYPGTWDEYFDDLVKGDHIVHGSWFDHVAGWWKYKDHPNVIFFKFEDMMKDPKKEIQRLAVFLDIDLSPEMVSDIAMDTSFTKMKENKLLNYEEMKDQGHWDTERVPEGFMRKGKVGDWKNYFNKDQSAYIEAKMDEYLKGTGLTFEYEI